MRPKLILAAVAVTAVAAACASAPITPTAPAGEETMKNAPATEAPKATPPVAEKRPHVTKIHGQELHDDYHWLRYREDAAVISYLEAENAYTDAMTAHTAGLRKKLYDEMLGRIVEDDSSVPARKGDYWYYTRTETGKAYAIHCRKRGGLDGAEEVLLDVNALAEGKDYTKVGVLDVSPDHKVLAYSVDETGAERYVMHFKDLATGEVHAERIPDTYYSSAWASDSRTFFYTVVDEASRPWRLYRHVVGTDGKQDVLVHEEADDAYFLSVGRTRSEAYILAELESAVTTEVLYLDATKPEGKFVPVHPRQQGMEYEVDHHGDRFFILSNEGAQNFKLLEAPAATPSKEHWKEVIAHREDVTLTSVEAFAGHLVILERERGLPQLRVRPLTAEGGEEHLIAIDEATYDAWPDDNPEFATTTLRYGFESLVTPESVFDYDMVARTRELKKQKEVRGYDKAGYTSERVWAKAKDGVEVPISLVRAKGTKQDGKAPFLLYGYGSYGISYEPAFSSNWLSLLDRGFTVGIAHVRGGGDMGRKWKDDGKFEKKMNTFTDFIACAEHLVAKGYTAADRLAISGGSAGGLLMGAVANLRPDLFAVVEAHVPFVDVINTMLDETIPLTVIEWEEWGNPNEPGPFKTMIAYSPYDNVTAKAYPTILIRAGLNDPRVQYWEPAKWTAKLRALKTDDNLLVLKTNMGAGHGGASGRYGRLEERAFDYAFVVDQLARVLEPAP
jgi:oligopeptidase B